MEMSSKEKNLFFLRNRTESLRNLQIINKKQVQDLINYIVLATKFKLILDYRFKNIYKS